MNADDIKVVKTDDTDSIALYVYVNDREGLWLVSPVDFELELVTEVTPPDPTMRFSVI